MKRIIVLILTGAMILTSLTACGTKNQDNNKEGVKTVDLDKLVASVKEAYGDEYTPDMVYDEAALEEMFGLPKELYEQAIAEGPMISNSSDVFVAVKAAKEKAEQVEKALNDYRDYLVNESMQYPTNKVKVQASKVIRHGDYVFFVLLGGIPMETEDKGEEAILTKAKERVKIAVDVIDGYFKE